MDQNIYLSQDNYVDQTFSGRLIIGSVRRNNIRYVLFDNIRV